MKTLLYTHHWRLGLALALFSLSVCDASAQPTITTQPTDQTANQGYSASFEVRATTGRPPLRYQWFSDTNLLADATANKLTISNALPANAGSYFVVVGDATGSITS